MAKSIMMNGKGDAEEGYHRSAGIFSATQFTAKKM